MTVINTNTAAINAQYNLNKVQNAMDTAMERLSSGKRINTAADDAAGVAISSRMTSEIKGTQMAIRNALDAQSLIDTAEGAHVEVENILQRMRELAVQASNETYADSDRANLQIELDQLNTELDRIAQSTIWGGRSLLNGSSTDAINAATSHTDTLDLQFQVGASAGAVNQVGISIGAISASALGVGDGSAVAEVGGASTVADAANANATVSIEGGKISFSGAPKQGDVFKFDVNGEEISVTYSLSDEYTDDLSGLGAQVKDALEAKINDNSVAPSLNGVSVVDHGDGSVTLSQAAVPTLDVATNDENGGSTLNNSSMTISGDTVTMAGTYDNGDKFGVTINGVAIEITAATSNAYSDTFQGLSAQLKDAIDSNADLNGTVSVIDNKDGSVTLSQNTAPTIQAAEVTYSNTQATDISFSATTATTNATVKLSEVTTPTAGEVNAIILKTADGQNAIEFAAKSDTNSAGDTAKGIKAAFDALADKKGFTASISNNEVSFTRNDGQDISVEKSASTVKMVEITEGTLNDGAALSLYLKAGNDELVLTEASHSDVAAGDAISDIADVFLALSETDRKGFKMAEIQDGSGVTTALQFYRTDGTTFDVKSTSDDLSHDAGNNSGAASFTALTPATATFALAGGSAATEAGDTLKISVFEVGSNTELFAITTDDLGAGSANTVVAQKLEDAFNGVSGNKTGDTTGFSVSKTNGNADFNIIRADGRNFKFAYSQVGGVGSTPLTITHSLDGGPTDVTSLMVANTPVTVATTTAGNENKQSIASAVTLASNLKEDVTSGGATVTTTAVRTTAAFGGIKGEAALTFSGNFVAGKEYSVDILGTTVSIVGDENDGFENSLNGLANKMSQAINDAGIVGISAAATNQYVEITAAPSVTNARVVADVGTNTDSAITITSDNDNTGTEAKIALTGTIDDGDTFAFSVNGHDFEIMIGADGYKNTDAGIRAQMKSAIDAAGIAGLVVTEGASNKEVVLNMDLDVATNSKSTVVTNVGTRDTASSVLTAENGTVTVSGDIARGDVFNFEVAGTALSVTAGANGAELTANGVASQIASAVTAAGLSNVTVNNNNDGSVTFNTTGVAITDAQSAVDSIAAIDNALLMVSSQRAELGGVSNRLDATVANMSNVTANLQSSQSRIQDADFATETSALTKAQILSQAATAMLAQANASKQSVLSLLQG